VPHCDACGGVWKPEVTFFGESLPKRVGKKLEADRSACARIIAQIVQQMIAALLWRSRQHISS
jgi:NAD-dependent SIR2 family protein deacetylase